MNNLISERHARSLLQLKDDTGKQREVLNRITSERLTVKDTDELIKNMMGGSNMNEISQPTYTPTPEPITNSNISNSFNMPSFGTDTFNLNQLNDPNLNIPSSPLTSEVPEFNLNNELANMANISEPLNVSEPKAPSFDIPNFDSLLKVEEEKVDTPLESQIPQPKIEPAPPVNRFFPSFEDTPANMSFTENYSLPSMDYQPTPTPAPVQTTNLSMAINNTRDMIKNLEGNGYKIETEELDLPDVYQITIKINKN